MPVELGSIGRSFMDSDSPARDSEADTCTRDGRFNTIQIRRFFMNGLTV